MNYTKLQLSLLLFFSCSLYGMDDEHCSDSAIPNEFNAYEVEIKKQPEVSSRYLFKSTIATKPKPYLTPTTQTGIGILSAGALCLAPSLLPEAQRVQLRSSLDFNNSKTQNTLLAGLATFACIGVISNRLELQRLQTEQRRCSETQKIINSKLENGVKNLSIEDRYLKDLLTKRITRTKEALHEEIQILNARLIRSELNKRISSFFYKEESNDEINIKINNAQKDLSLIDKAEYSIQKSVCDDVVVLVTTQMQPQQPRPLLKRMFGWREKTTSTKDQE